MNSGTAGEAVNRLLSAENVSAGQFSVESRIDLCRECLEGVFDNAMEWTESAAIGKGLPTDSPFAAEDILSGPVVVARQLQLTIQTLSAIRSGSAPHLPGKPARLSNGQLCVPVFPTAGYFDSLTFMGLRGAVRMQEGVELNDIHGDQLNRIRRQEMTGTSLVLGAGNVSSIPATDSLNRIMFEGRRVLLKLNPVNEYLAPVFEKAFAGLIREHLLAIITGGADVGAELISHERVDDIHITGSAATHDRIVWGSDPEEASLRKRNNSPRLAKPVTSELGNVTPWIIVPGRYSRKQLYSQAQHLAASITNNVSFNCLATKVIVIWDKWDQREEFLRMVQSCLDQIPLRPAYYPGAAERFRRFTNSDVSPDDQNRLPWTLLRNQRDDERPELFREESFVCVCAETTLAGRTPSEFLETATDFVNDRMTGTLCASVTIPNGFQSQHSETFERSLRKLKYGSVCVNQWSGLAYGLVSPPWGAYPGATLQNTESGIGNVHNTYLLDNIEKTVLEGPLINFPKPIWFSSHRNAVDVATQLLKLYHRPAALRLPRLFAAALTG